MVAAAATALAAHQAGTLGVGLSGGGFVIPFVLGVLNMLYIELGILKHDMPVAGGSTGALCTMFASGTVSMPAMRHIVEHVSSKCRARGNCYGVLQKVVTEEAREMIPADGSDRLNRHGRTYIAVSYPSAHGEAPASFELINKFNDEEDVVATLGTSTFIPMWSAPSMVTNYRGREAYDGSMAGGLDSFLPCPPGVGYCLRISTMPAGGTISRGLFEDFVMGPPQEKAKLINTLLHTAHGADMPSKIGELLQGVTSSGPQGVARNINRFNKWVDGLMALEMPGEGKADIWPGRRHALPTTRLGWCTWVLAPPTPEERQAMFELGRAEALSWAQEQGFASASQRVSPPERLSSISMFPKKK